MKLYSQEPKTWEALMGQHENKMQTCILAQQRKLANLYDKRMTYKYSNFLKQPRNVRWGPWEVKFRFTWFEWFDKVNGCVCEWIHVWSVFCFFLSIFYLLDVTKVNRKHRTSEPGKTLYNIQDTPSPHKPSGRDIPSHARHKVLFFSHQGYI